jgi:arylsulfatase
MIGRAMRRIAALALLALVSCAYGRNLHSHTADEPPPNFVVIFTDDQGYGDLGVQGAQGFSTPNIDRLAAEGMRFTSFYVGQAVCSASRAALLTGCYPNRIGIRGALGPDARVGLSDAEATIAEVLRQRGYASGIFGKWHLGHHRRFLPLQHGFGCYLGLPYSNDMWPVGYDGKPLHEGWKAKHPPLPLIDGNDKVAELHTLEDQSALTTRYTERAVQFIADHANRPFFLYVPHSMPHVPLAVSDKFRGRSEQGAYGDVIMEIDWSVGEILAALQRHGLERRTLVVFASDNGPWLNYGNHAGSSGGLREGKGTSWEGGQRVPCIMRWPGRIAPGTTCDAIAATIDLLPTFAALADAPLPDHPIDGVDVRPLLDGRAGAAPRDHFFYYYTAPDGDRLQAVRQQRWKLHFPHDYRSYEGAEPGRDGWPGPTARGTTELALYDLADDPAERRDVAHHHPDVVARLQALGEAARAELGDGPRRGSGVRPAGRADESDGDGR